MSFGGHMTVAMVRMEFFTCYAIPEANPAMYFGLNLGIMFPLKILIGIRLYTDVAKHFLG